MPKRLQAVLAAFVPALLALASAGAARQVDAPVQLVAPRAGAALTAGSTAEIEWAPLAGFAALQGAEEWEAFLSVDGGATYSVRITPHLDCDLRHFRFQVPPIPTANARLLLRFGDERRETAVVLPQRFAVVKATSGAAPALETSPLSRQAFTAGEPALPGHPGVVSWVEGSRRGAGLRQVVAVEPPGVQAQPEIATGRTEAAILASDPTPPPFHDAIAENDPKMDPPGRRRSRLGRAGTGPSLSSDILLLTQRQNE